MSFLNIGQELQDRQPETAVEEGEYKLRVTAADIPEGKNYMLVRFEVQDNPYAREMSKFFTLPGHGRTPKEENRNRNMLGYFFEAFGIDPAGQYDVGEEWPNGFVGCEGWALIGPPEDDGGGYGPQNKIKRFVSGN